jgi:hypothetical protein
MPMTDLTKEMVLTPGDIEAIEREAFEYWCFNVTPASANLNTGRNPRGDYADDRADGAWHGWQARALLFSRMAGPVRVDDSNLELCEIVQALWDRHKHSRATHYYMDFAEDVLNIGRPVASGSDESILHEQIRNAMAAYLRRCRTGGMDNRLSDQISGAVAHMLELGYLPAVSLEPQSPQPPEATTVTNNPPAGLTEEEKTEILDWASACQSAYHIASTPGHRFGALGSNLEENREGLIEYVESLLARRRAGA